MGAEVGIAEAAAERIEEEEPSPPLLEEPKDGRLVGPLDCGAVGDTVE